MTNMSNDCQRARATYIRKTVEIREQLSFAHPVEILKALQVLSTDAYGSMVWDLSCDQAEQYFKSWNTCIKLVYGVPRSTFTYLVEGFLAGDQVSLRNQVLSRYPGFYRSLLNSSSEEVSILARIVSRDPRSTTYRNLKYLERLTKLRQPEFYTAFKIKEALPVQKVPVGEQWRLGLLTSLLKIKIEKFIWVEDNKHICAMIDSLAST